MTVGTQCAFPRLVDAVDAWAAEHPEVGVYAQTAEEDGGWSAVEHVAFLQPDAYRRYFAEADLIVGHVGMGTIVSALEGGKPVVVMPRRASLGEHRNEHQTATAERFRGCPAVTIVEDAQALPGALDDMLASLHADRLLVPPPDALAERIRREIRSAGDKVRDARLLAVASGGGHWVQLCRILDAVDHPDTVCATTELGDAALAPAGPLHRVRDGNRWDKWGLLRSAGGILRLVWRVRPDVVLTTGAAPGYFALRFGKLLGAKTIWIDSIANAEELSLSGQKAGKYADLWLTQWPELARPEGPAFAGSVLPVFERAEPVRGTGAAPACEQPGRASDVAAQA